MLVLRRMAGEQVQIGSEIIITVLQSARGRVRVGIDAPEGTTIRRGELEPDLPVPNSADDVGRSPTPNRPNG